MSQADATTERPSDLPNPKSTASFWHSEPSPLLLGHRSTRELPNQADVVVVGSGITGASVAHHLLRHHDEDGKKENEKLNVVMLEAREACWGATGRNGGHCQPLLYDVPTDPSIGHFELRNFASIQSLIASKSIDCEFYPQPGVRALMTSADLADADKSLATLQKSDASLAARVKLVTDKDELRRLKLGPKAKGAIVTDIAARMWPYRFVARILEDLLTSPSIAGRFNLQTHTPVTAIKPTGDASQPWSIQTERGTMTARNVVLATNAYTSHLVPSFADVIVPCRGQMSALKPPPTASGESRLQTSFGFVGHSQDDYLIQRPNERGGHLMFGGGRPNGHALGVTDDSVIDDRTATYLRRSLFGLLDLGDGEETKAEEKLELEAVNEWTGIMGFSRDNVPWVGPVPSQPGMFMSAGYTGHGMPNTWLCGAAAAAMVVAMEEGADEKAAVQAGIQEVGLPKCYILNDARLERVRKMETVRKQDERMMFKAEAT